MTRQQIVEINGVRYVPATEATPGTADVLYALASQFWGDGHVPPGKEGFAPLRIHVSDDFDRGEGETFDEFAARLREQVGDR
jgi:hypothetical protein